VIKKKIGNEKRNGQDQVSGLTTNYGQKCFWGTFSTNNFFFAGLDWAGIRGAFF